MPDATKKKTDQTEPPVTRKQLIASLNEDLGREYQAIIAYVVYSQVLLHAAKRVAMRNWQGV